MWVDHVLRSFGVRRLATHLILTKHVLRRTSLAGERTAQVSRKPRALPTYGEDDFAEPLSGDQKKA